MNMILLEIVTLGGIISLFTNFLSKFLIKKEQLHELQKRMKKIQELMIKNMMSIHPDSNIKVEKINEIYKEYKEFTKTFIIFQVKQFFIFLVPFLLGIATIKYFNLFITLKLPNGLTIFSSSINSIWIYILSYVAFNSLISVLFAQNIVWEYAKTMAKN